ncbi:MAG: hypothetical protein ACO1OB_20925 [Archangium sp.]
MRELAPNLVQGTVLTAAEAIDGVEVEVAFAWQPRASSSLINSFENGVASEAARAGLIKAVGTYVRAKRGSKEKTATTGLVGIVRVTHSSVDAKTVEKAVNQVVMRVINSSPQWWSTLHEAMR